MLVYIPTDFPYAADLFPTTRALKYAQTLSTDDADILVRLGGDRHEIVIEPLTGTITQCHREARFPLKSGPTYLPKVMDGIDHFNYCLDLFTEASPLKGSFALEMHRLRGEYTQRRPNLDGNMIVDGVVRFQSDAGAKYGFTIRNTSDVPVFPYLFYFDPGTYTIQQWYVPTRAALPPGATVTVGIGNELAFEFELEPGQQESSGFLKLFVTRHRLDLGWMTQGVSPFNPGFQQGLDAVGRAGFEKSVTPMQWDTLTVILTMTAK
ncbi:hypothetical protein C8R47DRAFT_1139385 [Mycena vitilis]|nr:hypothetical protein C8R47DRAFT_1139385 [Mycena vitilis]